MVEGLSHVLLGDYIIHIFNDEIHMGRNVRYVVYCLTSSGGREIGSDYIIHTLKIRCEELSRILPLISQDSYGIDLVCILVAY